MGIKQEGIEEETILDRYNNNDFYTRSEETVFQILNDLTSRKGLENEWDSIDNEIKEGIINKYVKIVEENHN